MDEERSKLEYELSIIDKRLEKDKTKRNIIMIAVYSVICGFVLSAIDKNVDTLKEILDLIIPSIFLGGFFYFITMSAFVLVTE